MPASPDNHDVHDYAERIRERLPRRLQELRERCGLSKHGLARERGLSRGYITKRRVVMSGIRWGSPPPGSIKHWLVSTKPPASPSS